MKFRTFNCSALIIGLFIVRGVEAQSLADFDGSGKVDFVDFIQFAGAFGDDREKELRGDRRPTFV